MKPNIKDAVKTTSNESITMPEIKEKEKVEIHEMLLTEPVEERQTIVHCTHFTHGGFVIRACRGTVLVDKVSGHQSKLLAVENITLDPQWTPIEKTGDYHFTLIFEGLPKSCVMFDMVEVPSDPNPFDAYNIPRNQTDVYSVEV